MLLNLLIFFLSTTRLISGLDNGLALTPPMGWLSWQRFRCEIDCKTNADECISENLYMAMADRLVSDGYRDLGYIYVNIDDCWAEKERDPVTDELVPDRQRFPHGIKWLAKYMHERGLKLGIYADYGTRTCAAYPGSLGYLEIDAKTFASWNVDMVKFDGCFSDPKTAKFGFPAFAKALNETGRPILYSCEWPFYEWLNNISVDYQAVASHCNLFRNFRDVDDSFESIRSIINHYANNSGNFLEVVKPGSFVDPDMVVVGDFGLSYDQQRLQLGMWAIFAAPLFMSNDLRKIDPQSAALLQNRFLISIDQDPLGKAGKLLLRSEGVQFWFRQLNNDAFAIAAINLTPGGAPINSFISLAELGLMMSGQVVYKAFDVFEQTSVGLFGADDKIPLKINPTGIAFLVFKLSF